MSPPTPGTLREQLILEQQVRTPAPGGGATLTWQAIGPLWADIRARSGRETVVADALVAHVSHDIWIRHRAGTTAGMRLRVGTRHYDILAVLPAGARNQWMQCLAREAAP